jgi:class 3 adenylate cyclase
MMRADEAGTLAALKSRRSEILQPLVAKHHGRIVKLVGDGCWLSLPARSMPFPKTGL